MIEDQIRRAVLDQPTKARHHTAKGQRVAAAKGQVTAQVEVIAQAHCCTGIQRGTRRGVQHTGAERSIGANHQRTGVEGRGAGVSIVARKRQARYALLDQPGTTADNPAKGQRVHAVYGQIRVQGNRIAGCQRSIALQNTCTRHGQGTGT